MTSFDSHALKTQIQHCADQHFPALQAWRRHLHQHPELSFHESETAAYISRQLTQMGIPHTTGIAGNGIAGTISGQNPSAKVVALRADFDALPIQEYSDKPYKSVNDGVMHACGHDGHTAMLLCAARILQDMTPQFSGSIRLIFQPAEEKQPGGAKTMIAEGVLENPRPICILGTHAHHYPAGTIAVKGGQLCASVDDIHITVHGKGGHGAYPQLAIDPIAIAAQIIVSLQHIVSRIAKPTIPTVLTFGAISGQGATNIIPETCSFSGTFRTLDETWRAAALEQIERLAQQTAAAFGAQCTVKIVHGYPSLINSDSVAARVHNYALDYVGESLVRASEISMGSEDFAYFTQEIPGCFYNLGTANPEKGIQSVLHTPDFDMDEEALKIGAGFMAFAAIQELQ